MIYKQAEKKREKQAKTKATKKKWKTIEKK